MPPGGRLLSSGGVEPPLRVPVSDSTRPSFKDTTRRAREIWEENGCPSGRDKEFWFQAEREFREAEELAKRVDAGS